MQAQFSEKGFSGMKMSASRGLSMVLAAFVRSRCAVAVAAMLMALPFVGATPARADFRVCNATQNLVGVGIGYRTKAGWVTEGWWHVDGSSCKTLIEGPLASRFY